MTRRPSAARSGAPSGVSCCAWSRSHRRLALKASRAANGVSELHGQVSREMWQPLYPGKSAEQVPIGHITNGVHLLGWMKGPVRRYWRRKLSELTDEKGEPTAGGDSTRFWRSGGPFDIVQTIEEGLFVLGHRQRIGLGGW
jgi:hypothetical protein